MNYDEYLSYKDVLEINADERNMLNNFPSYEEYKDAVFQMKLKTNRVYRNFD